MRSRLAVLGAVFKDAAVNWVDDYAQSMGAALAFYAMFSIAPVLLIVTFVAGTVFGAAAALVVVLLWVYYSAQFFLFGAEFTWVYGHRFGSRRGQPIPGVAVPRPDPAGPASG
jgi:membrane protein